MWFAYLFNFSFAEEDKWEEKLTLIRSRLDLAVQDFKTTFINMLKENVIIISEQIRNLSREIKTIKINGNCRVEKCNAWDKSSDGSRKSAIDATKWMKVRWEADVYTFQKLSPTNDLLIINDTVQTHGEFHFIQVIKANLTDTGTKWCYEKDMAFQWNSRQNGITWIQL